MDWKETFHLDQRVTMNVESVVAEIRHMSLVWEPKVWEAGQ